jgi:hypothetical protein
MRFPTCQTGVKFFRTQTYGRDGSHKSLKINAAVLKSMSEISCAADMSQPEKLCA